MVPIKLDYLHKAGFACTAEVLLLRPVTRSIYCSSVIKEKTLTGRQQDQQSGPNRPAPSRHVGIGRNTQAVGDSVLRSGSSDTRSHGVQMFFIQMWFSSAPPLRLPGSGRTVLVPVTEQNPRIRQTGGETVLAPSQTLLLSPGPGGPGPEQNLDHRDMF